jgi:hypothetical protein
MHKETGRHLIMTPAFAVDTVRGLKFWIALKRVQQTGNFFTDFNGDGASSSNSVGSTAAAAVG